ncbi:Acyl-coenzyme A:6-aminopenicillanic acid acyl-transferase [Bifidobacterium lemurum]|uniref:Acyl-coenzyme A:6-aminopenicillanic acid acyl-transferase n=1 Tax=Bifidobacterium lemurum TaxID=1603886 RepID=A0A261FKQ1_9BIFI|nr:C45 family peptidase [Bifidobacterium lemurum]OZG59563.1 Acyl-coenzyme A:6-aminopenicillanic acid acyl-transferase [Bifidobacterium lemurum]QOL35011.1 hypothetical protein BL8807_03805 [Bifidobacterium lemurum]
MMIKKNRDLSGLTWMTLSGGRNEVFEELGRVFGARIREVIRSMPERESLLRWRGSSSGAVSYQRMWNIACRDYPQEMAELAAMARGAGMELEEIFLANIRGDIGFRDGTGCTDILYCGGEAPSFGAHNEDGAPAVGRGLTWLTLLIDGELPVLAQWYPGFLPCNAFTVNACGLAWGINHLSVGRPGPYAGRHFVARRLQGARNVDEAIDFLRSHPMAGGFSFNFSDAASGRLACVECAAGRVAVEWADAERPYRWHSNHLLMLDDAMEDAGAAGDADAAQVAYSLGPVDESRARGRLLASRDPGAVGDSVDEAWLLELMAKRELPEGVYRTARDGDPLETLCTTVYNLSTRSMTICGHGEVPETYPVANLLVGL